MSLTKDQVKKVAKLANLSLTSQEEEKYTQQLSKILDYMEKLNSADISGVEPTFNVSGLDSVAREDKPQATLSQEEVLSNAPQKKNGMFITEGVFDEK